MTDEAWVGRGFFFPKKARMEYRLCVCLAQKQWYKLRPDVEASQALSTSEWC